MFEYDFFKFLYTIFVFSVILAIAYYVTKIIAKKGAPRSKSKNMKVVETLPIGIDKSVVLIKVGKQFVLLGNTTKNLTYFSAFDEDKLGISDAHNELEDFNTSFESYMEEYTEEETNPYFNPIKKNLDKLKSIVRGTKSDE